MGHRRCVEGYDRVRPNSITRNKVGAPRRLPYRHATCPTTPQVNNPESEDHVQHTLQSCHNAVAAPLSEVPQEGSTAFSLFSLIKLHLASQPSASS